MNKPHNPGLSEKAWKKLHQFVSKMNIKYSNATTGKSDNKSVSA